MSLHPELPPASPIGTPESERSPKPRQAPTPHVSHSWAVSESLDFTSARTAFQGGSFRPVTRKTFLFSFLANIIDQLLVLSAVLLSLALFLYFNRGQNYFLAEKAGRLRLVLPAILTYGFFLAMIMTIPRIFLGCSPGEWTCNLRLGNPEQRFSSKYIFYVLRRELICLMTGGFLLLVLSIVTGKDWAGKISRVPLVEKSGV